MILVGLKLHPTIPIISGLLSKLYLSRFQYHREQDGQKIKFSCK